MKKSGLAAGFLLAATAVLSPFLLESCAGPIAGTPMRDGTVYAGSLPDKQPLYTTLLDAPGVYDWNGGKAYCEALKAGGHKDWTLPTEEKLNVLYNNHAAIGNFYMAITATVTDQGFKEGDLHIGQYWSSTSSPSLPDIAAIKENFTDGGRKTWSTKDSKAHVRCVR